MHELAICQDLLTQVSHIADEHGATRVDKIIAVIGPLSGVEILLLERAFSVARCGTVAADAVLETEPCDILVHCRQCDATSAATANNLTCRQCGDWRVDVTQGEEMLLRTVELSGINGNADDHHASATEAANGSEHV